MMALSLWSMVTTYAPYLTTMLFFGTAVFLTLWTGCIQIRAFPRFLRLVRGSIAQRADHHHTDAINPFHALFAAMATTIGMGNIVGPGVAILAGGPGALFWLIVYIFFAAATKFTEVTFALETRIITPEGNVIGGPMQYLRAVSSFLAAWYAHVAVVLFLIWSLLQANTLATIYELESVPKPLVSICLAVLVLVTLHGGAQRVGNIASKLVPAMFTLYMLFALSMLISELPAVCQVLSLVIKSAFHPQVAFGCFAGATMLHALQAGTFKGIFITEAGVGTASIPHAMAATKRPTDQGILALFSMISDALISLTSGLLVLVMNVCQGPFRSTMIYEAFRLKSPVAGRFVLLATVTLFVITTVIGNAFNGMQTFASITQRRWIAGYVFFTAGIIFLGPLLAPLFAWTITDIILALVAIPNVIGLLILAYKRASVLKI